MALTFFWRCEGTTLDGTHDYSAGGTTATGFSSVAINSTAVRVGTNGIQAPSASDYYSISATGIYGTTGSAAFSLYVAGGTWTADAVPFMMDGTGGAGSANDRIRVTTVTGGNLSLQLGRNGWGSQTITTTGGACSVGNWYGVVIRWSATNADYRLEIYNSSGTLIDSVENLSADSSLFPQTANIDTLLVGELWGTTLNNYIDNVFVANAYDEALQSNLTITSYTGYGGGGSAPTITDAGDESYVNGETGIVITGTSFGASQGTGSVKISPTDDVDDANAVAQTVTAWGDTSVTFTCVKGSLAFNTNLYLFVTKDGGYSNASGHVVQIAGTRKLKVFTHSSAAGATGVDIAVYAAPTTEPIHGALIGQATGQAFEASLESGQAVLKVPVAAFGGGALTTSDTPRVLARNGTYTTGNIPATVIEE